MNTEGARPLPHLRWRRWMVYPITQIGLWIIGRPVFGLRAVGLKHVPRTGPVILASNHSSYLDPPVIGTVITCRHVWHMARINVFRTPVFRWWIRQLGAFPIKTKGDWRAGMATALKLLKVGEAVVVYPEGTRTRDGNLQPGKAGIGWMIHHAKTLVIPIYIEGTYKALPRGRRMVRWSTIEVRFGPPVRLEAWYQQPQGEATYQGIVDAVMDDIRKLEMRGKAG